MVRNMVKQIRLHVFELINDVLHKDGMPYNVDDDLDYGYEEVINGITAGIDWEYEQEDDWQGEWAAIGRDPLGNYYYQTDYFGTCSGCDWLQSIQPLGNNIETVEFLNKMSTVIKFSELNELVEYLEKEKINACFISKLLDRHIRKCNLRDEIHYTDLNGE